MRFLILLTFISCCSISAFTQGYDVDNNTPPQIHSSTIFQADYPLVEKWGLLIMPPCCNSIINNTADISISMISKGGFEPLSIQMTEDSTVEIMLQSTCFVRRRTLDNGFRLPYEFSLRVIFDTDTAEYKIAYDSLKDSISIEEKGHNGDIDFLYLETILNIPEEMSWIIFNRSEFKALRKFREAITNLAQPLILDDGYYRCMPYKITKARFSDFSVNKISDSFIQFFKIRGNCREEINNLISTIPEVIAYQLN